MSGGRIWTEKDNLALIKAYNAGVKLDQLGAAIGWSHNTARHHLKTLLKDRRVSHRNLPMQTRKCTGDCDNCPFPDCRASAAKCLQLQRKQEDERYSKLPPCDQHVIDWRKSNKDRLITGSCEKSGRLLLGANNGTYT